MSEDSQQCRRIKETCSQLLGLPRRQDLAHGDRRYIKLEVTGLVCLPQGNAPGRRALKVCLLIFVLDVGNYALEVESAVSD